MKKITYSSPARIYLSGEHAVVYGKPALVSAIDLRLTFSLFRDKTNTKDETILFIADKVKAYLKNKNIPHENYKFNYKITSTIPIGRGLGSSAALSTASVAAFLQFYSGKEFSKEDINNIGYQVEKYFHRNPSGVDVSASCFGGLIYYRKEFEFLKNISALNFKIPKRIEDNLYLVDSGKPQETTAEMINVVGKMFNTKPRFVEEILNDIEKTTKRMTVSLIKEDSVFFQRALVNNQILLEMLGVVSEKAKNILKKLERYGVGKVTGSGGGKAGSGYLLFYAQNNKEFERYGKKINLSFFKFRQSMQGLRDENDLK